jgi:hypothetical protein
MKFVFTPEEAQKTARMVSRSLVKQGFKVKVERAYSEEVPYRTTILAQLGQLTKFVEAQGAPDFHRELQDLSRWLAAAREYAELYLATSEEGSVTPSMLQGLRREGVGLLIVESDGAVVSLEKARNPALTVTPEPTLKYGHCKNEVKAAVEKFNQTDRKDGLRDMCEIVERETESLAVLAARRGLLKMSVKNITEGMDWSSQINTLASVNSYNAGVSPMVAADLKDDLHSFTRGRNLVNHKVRTKKEDARRQRQFAERMMQGPRLAAELVSLQRKIR